MNLCGWQSSRNSTPKRLLRTCFWAQMLLWGGTATAQRNVVVVRPKEIQDVLVNPGMGITTFQRFNGQALNPPLTWSEEGPTERLVDAEPRPEFPRHRCHIADGFGT